MANSICHLAFVDDILTVGGKKDKPVSTTLGGVKDKESITRCFKIGDGLLMQVRMWGRLIIFYSSE